MVMPKSSSETQNNGESELSKALKDFNLSQYVDGFIKQGFTSWPELGADEKEARESIELVIDKNEHRGDINRVLRAWKATVEKKPESDPKDLLTAPDLPEGTELDLSSTTVTVEEQTYTIPDQLATKKTGDPVESAADLNQTQWIMLAKRTNILKAINIDSAILSVKKNGGQAKHAAFFWKVPGNNDFFDPNDASQIESTLAYTESAKALAHNRIFGADLSFSIPYASAKASMESGVKNMSLSRSAIGIFPCPYNKTIPRAVQLSK